MLKNICIAGETRTAIGAFSGVFANTSANKLGTTVVRSTLERAQVPLDAVDEVVMGCVLSAGLGQNVARQSAIGGGLPVTCGATTVNKMCGSSMRAIRLAAQAIQCGDSDLIVAGGTENMTLAPYLLPKARSGYRMGHGEMLDSMIYDGLSDAFSHSHMGELAESCAKKYELSRQQQDDFAVESYRRAQATHAAGGFADEIAKVDVKTRKGTVVVDVDEEPGKFSEERLRSLKPAFGKEGTITAGNASSISDGAAAVVVVSEDKAKSLHIKPSARILGYAAVAIEPAWFTLGPIHAIRKLCDRTNLKLADVDLFEINEAFATVTLVTMKELDLPHEKVNVRGGAVAIGHPIGASGARILVTLINALRERGKRIGIATACIGGGEAGAVAIELL